VPIAPTFNDDSDVTIAVNLGGKPDPDFHPATRPDEPPVKEGDFGQKIADFIKGLDIPDKVSGSRGAGMMEIADRTFDAMQSAIARQQLAAYPPDIELVIPNNVCGTLEFDRADEMILMGYELAARKLVHL
jgi:NTE family protein